MAEIYRSWRSDVRRTLPIDGSAAARIVAFFLTQEIWSVTVFRTGQWMRTLPRPLRLLNWIWFTPWHKLVQIATGIDIPSSVKAGRGLYICHPGGIVLNGGVVLGSDVNLSQQVTIGVGGFGDRRGTPVIGDRVYIGPGAKIFGPITIGDESIIGANAVVNRSVPPRSIVVGVPGRVIREATEAEIAQVIYGNDPPAGT
jgi:serine O-acetyltransferase